LLLLEVVGAVRVTAAGVVQAGLEQAQAFLFLARTQLL
jgi:hypothetical protein